MTPASVGLRAALVSWVGRCIVRGHVARRTNARKSAPDSESNGDAAEDATTIDAVLDGLEGVVRELEGGDLPLEEALARFERGVALARQGGAMLDRVEERVEMLLAERDQAVPLSADAESDSDEEPSDGDDR